MKIRQWIMDFGGVLKLARAIGVSRQIIYYWMEGGSFPRRLSIDKIAELSKGAVTIADWEEHWTDLNPPTNIAV